MNSPLPLHDIAGIGAVSLWPPGPGWIAVAVAVCVCVIAMMYMKIRARSAVQLRAPESGASVYERAVVLAENARRYALAVASRDEVAGLRGDAWLNWLRDHDAAGFRWDVNATWLNDAGYAPEGSVRIPEKDVAAAEEALATMARRR